jgi:hypothetical protein
MAHKHTPNTFIMLIDLLLHLFQIMLRAADHHCQVNVAVHPFQNIMIDEASAVK